MSKGINRNRLAFFNYSDGLRLKTSIQEHTPMQEIYSYCELCGQHRKKVDDVSP